MKRKKIAALIAILLMLILTISIGTLSVATSSGEYRRMGEIDSQILEYSTCYDENSIVIDKREIDAIAEKYELFGNNRTWSDAAEFVVRREVLYATAIQNGYEVSDEEVDEYINLQIELSSKAQNREIFDEFLVGIGMTLEEYWESQRPVFTKEILYGKYLSDYKERLMMRRIELNQETWNNEIQLLVESAKEGFNIRIE